MTPGSRTLTVHLMGGLGNQLFQYAFGRRLALANEAELLLDTSGYPDSCEADASKGQRVADLLKFRVHGQAVERHGNSGLGHRAARLPRKAANLLVHMVDRFQPYYARREIVEPPSSYFHFDHRVYGRHFSHSLGIRGFWQSERYFADIEPILRKELVLRDALSPRRLELAAAIQASESVAIHVRHGDNASSVAASLGVLPVEYYERASGAIRQECGHPRFFLFSDDIHWAQSFLKATGLELEPAHGGSKSAAEDLWLMSLCRHHVIANSTFSWWGAWLGRRPEQIVYAPRRYYQNKDVPNPDLYPASWRLI